MENTTAVPAKVTFNNLQALQNRINRHGEDLDILDQNIENFMTATNDMFYKMTLT